jgi:hypothetical protein
MYPLVASVFLTLRHHIIDAESPKVFVFAVENFSRDVAKTILVLGLIGRARLFLFSALVFRGVFHVSPRDRVTARAGV